MAPKLKIANLIGGTALLVAAAAGSAPAGEPSWVSLGELVGGTPRPAEREVLARTAESLPWSGGETVSLGPDDVALKALENNLEVRISRGEAEAARQALEEARAVFDPLLQVSLSLQREDTHDRSFVGTVRRKAFNPTTPQAIPTSPFITTPQIQAIHYRTQSSGLESRSIAASSDPDYGGKPSDTATLSASLQQQLPWGGSISVWESAAHHEVYYDKWAHSWDAPWAANLLLQLQLPMPGTKGFGELSDNRTNQRRSELAEQAAQWSVKGLINDILLEGHLAYWDLVERYETLQARMEHSRLAAEQAERAARLSRVGEMTRYDLAQVEAEREQARILEEQAREELVAASNALGVLLESEPAEVSGRLRLPFAYGEALAATVKPGDVAELLRTAEAERAELHLQGTVQERAELEYAYRQNQALADLSLSASINASQDGSTYGYEDLGRALNETLNPDQLSQSYSLSYRRALGNRAERAAVERTRQGVEDANLALTDRRNQVRQEVLDAVAEVESSQARVAAAKRRESVAADGYRRLKRAFELGEKATAISLVEYLRTLLDARQAVVSALVDHKRAEARLLAAQGILAPRQTEERAAANAFEQRRLERLEASRKLEYFGKAS